MKKFIFLLLMCMPVSYLQAAEIPVTMHALGSDGIEKAIGVIVVSETANGLRFQPHLQNLQPGNYTFSVNENVGCGSQINQTGMNIPGMAAGASMHQLPIITVNANGKVDTAITVDGLSLGQVRGRTLVLSTKASGMRTAHGDEARVACGSLELYR